MSGLMEQSEAKAIQPRYILVQTTERLRKKLAGQQTVFVSKMRDLEKALQNSSKSSVWIIDDPTWAEQVVGKMSKKMIENRQQHRSLGNLLMLKPATRQELALALHGLFERVVGNAPAFTMLPQDQLGTVLMSKNNADLFIGGISDHKSKTITLVRGNLDLVIVPFSMFASDNRPKPDFSKLHFGDYGYSIGLGDYEASAHSILYEVDPAYRKRFKKQRIAGEQGFGPSLRRLRLARGLTRTDFPGISEKTIARIERGETDKPQGATINRIAKVLAVKPEEIEDY